MSIFSGIICEYPKMSFDNFNPLVSTYFLSHLHLDHIDGIEHFFPLVEACIYTSKVTEKLISGRYSEFKHIIPFIKGLEMKKSYQITVKSLGEQLCTDTEIIDITLIPSGHCLGSVMFLVKGVNGNVLYTGDFRVPVGFAHEILSEYNVKYLDTLYLDTTFMNKSCKYIPSREESLNVILNLIEKFLLQNPDNIIFINYKVRYTLEILYHLIYLKFNIKVHIDWKYYSQISELDESISYCMDPYRINSRIHACFMGDSDTADNFCREKLKKAKLSNNLLTIIPSTLWWSERHLINNKFIHYIDKYTIRVCFAHHSSYSEITDLISTIPTKTIHDCVSRLDFNF